MSRRTFSLLLFGLALLPRLYVAIAWTREPVWDGHYYDIGARSIAAGQGYAGLSGGAWCHYPVGYSGLLGLVYRLAGSGQYVGPLLNALLGSLLCWLTYALAQTAMNERRARIAGLLVALYPGLIAYTPLLMTECLAAVLLVAAAVAAVRLTGAGRRIVVAGIIIGLATLVRPQSLLCAPLLGLFALRTSSSPGAGLRQAVRHGALISATALLVVAPWTLRNCLVMDGCALVSTNGGWNLAIGSFPRATGRFASLRGSDGCRVVTGQVQQDRCWGQAGMRWIRQDPSRWLALIPKKLGHTFDHESFPIGYLSEADPQAWPASTQRSARGLLSWSYRLILGLAAFGLLSRPRLDEPRSWVLPILLLATLTSISLSSHSQPFWLIALAIPPLAAWRWSERPAALLYAAGAVASLVITHAVFFGEDRYHMVVAPLLCLLAANALRQATRPEADPTDDPGSYDLLASPSSPTMP